jgi:hypothetical protein
MNAQHDSRSVVIANSRPLNSQTRESDRTGPDNLPARRIVG